MPRLLVQAKKNLGRSETTRILVATSGDTGKAALAGYAGLDGIEIAVFYPNAGTSEIQRLQMVTQAGDNVAVYAVDGNFDDAQSGVKRVFGDAEVAEALAGRGIRLSSANSINWGRLRRRSSTISTPTSAWRSRARLPGAVRSISACRPATSVISLPDIMPSGWGCRWASWSALRTRTTSCLIFTLR